MSYNAKPVRRALERKALRRVARMLRDDLTLAGFTIAEETYRPASVYTSASICLRGTVIGQWAWLHVRSVSTPDGWAPGVFVQVHETHPRSDGPVRITDYGPASKHLATDAWAGKLAR